MAEYDTRKTPDYSPLVVHFTKARRMAMDDLIRDGDPLVDHKTTSALAKLISILLSRTIHAAPVPDIPANPRAVCFTECIWDALVRHAESYSPYGVVFSKRVIFERGGGPALYVRGDSIQAVSDDIPPPVKPLLVPFDPTAVLNPGAPIDTLYEREWRLPGPLAFDYSDIEYVTVDSISDATDVVRRIQEQNLPQRKVIPMEVYRIIRRAWSDE